MDACPGHILESTKGIERKFGSYIDGSLRKDTLTLIHTCIFIELSPLNHSFS